MEKLKIKIPIQSFLKKYIISNYAIDGILDYSANPKLSRDCPILFPGRKIVVIKNELNQKHTDVLEICLSMKQWPIYKLYPDHNAIRRAFTNKFSEDLGKHTAFHRKQYGLKIIECMELFLEHHDLMGEDITIDACRKYIERYEKLNEVKKKVRAHLIDKSYD